ncbi:MAG: UvrD-helicase domain-containing protein, partial [Gammaproteobacteria bacterium]|nr:UvrD-helicase domain-containing protein [Gammaproteobacteria bacterium]
MENITFISAGAGSGKTYRLTQDLGQLLTEYASEYHPSGVIATTFTKLAANELRGRVRQRLNETGHNDLAVRMEQALIGTVNGVCGQLLKRFAFEAGLSPVQSVIEEQAAEHLFSIALESVLTLEKVRKMNSLAFRLSIDNWQSEIKQLVQTARANNIASSQLSVFAKSSIEGLFEFLPKVSQRDLNKELLSAIQTAIDAIDLDFDITKGTKSYVSFIKDCQRKLQNNRYRWTDWVKLSKETPTKKSQVAAEPVSIVASEMEKNAKFQDDVKLFIDEIFQLAAQSMEQFQTMKQKKGMIDFVDQEQLLYQVLDNPAVAQVMHQELDLLMVDEFQDTSPIQLALFLKLAILAKKVIWVGDIKQAIYGFRGSDPELMIGIIEQLEKKGGTVKVLENSWRSCPELVSYVNEIFVPAFSNTLAKERVHLTPAFTTKKETSAVTYWSLKGSNATKREHSIAHGIKELISSEYPIQDRHKNTSRAIDYGDITLLARSNDTLDSLAVTLDSWGIPTARKTSGLLSTPESKLILAGLKFLLDPRRDSLSVTELLVLSECKEPEEWLNERLEFVQKESYKETDWGRGSEILQNLELQAPRLSHLAPSEALRVVVNAIQARKIVLQWSETHRSANQRLQNVNQLELMADEYEQICHSEKLPATVAGLVLWLNTKASDDLDLMDAADSEHAVKLITHHGAKGLEWPVVITLDLHKKVRSRLWGLKVTQNDDELNVNDALNGRALRYWPWAFGMQSTGIPLQERLETSPVGIKEKYNALEEDKRLMYVSFTRPSELLILPMQRPEGEWLDSVGATEWMLPEGSELELPETKEIIPTEFKEYDAEEIPSDVLIKKDDLFWFNTSTERTEKLAATVSPSSQKELESAKVIKVIELGDRVSMSNIKDMAQFGSALHAVIAVNMIHDNA